MSLTLAAPMRALIGNRCHRLAKCWFVQREDGVPLRFTDHDNTLEFQGFTYAPTGGGSLTAARRVAGLEPQQADFIGVLTSSAITFADLHAGRYRHARIDEYLIDWKYPFEGRFQQKRYWIEETRFDSGVWTAYLSTFPVWLTVPVGDTYGRNCRHTLYSNDPNKAGDCRVSQGMFAAANESMQVDVVLTPRLKFELLLIDNPQSNDYFNGGHLLWISGANAGLVSQVKDYQNSPTPRFVELELKTPNAIVDGDTFNMWRGCDKLFATCKTVFNNVPNNGGRHLIPGTDRVLKVPRR